MSNWLDRQPKCKKCGDLYPIEYSYHEDYCDDCYKKICEEFKKEHPGWAKKRRNKK